MAEAVPARTGEDREAGKDVAAAVYRRLTGRAAGPARTDDGETFDRHTLACLIAVASAEAEALETKAAARLGLDGSEISLLFERFFPGHDPTPFADTRDDTPVDDEADMLHGLLCEHVGATGFVGEMFAIMVAWRALEPNHLWEDMGLAERPELSRLMARHFPALAAANTNGMRWKRYLYRALCESQGFVACAAPTCAACDEVAVCFGAETGESRLAAMPRGRG
jgi:nitrogen fixation protein NifQ